MGAAAATATLLEPRWGFCADCVLWRLSDGWFDADPNRASCPVCGEEPSPLEVIENGVGRVLLVLELPPGTDLPILS